LDLDSLDPLCGTTTVLSLSQAENCDSDEDVPSGEVVPAVENEASKIAESTLEECEVQNFEDWLSGLKLGAIPSPSVKETPQGEAIFETVVEESNATASAPPWLTAEASPLQVSQSTAFTTYPSHHLETAGVEVVTTPQVPVVVEGNTPTQPTAIPSAIITDIPILQSCEGAASENDDEVTNVQTVDMKPLVETGSPETECDPNTPQILQLQEMGFKDVALIKRLLRKHQGDVPAAVEELMELDLQDWEPVTGPEE